MKISLDHISKKFQQHWIFKEISYEFQSPGNYALLGANGSGKSTLMRILAGIQPPTKGKLSFEYNHQMLELQHVFRHIAYCAPGLDIVEEMTLREFLDFHFTFKPILPQMTVDRIIGTIGLKKAAAKVIGDFSSGMKQRVKLAQAIFADTDVLLLDEPCTNLDNDGVQQYREWIDTYTHNRMVIVASNDVREYYFCQQHIDVEAYR